MSERGAHLVGSLPGEDAYQAMSTAMELLGPRLRSLPDGETGERRNWIIPAIEGLRSHPDLELARTGDWSDYDATPRFRVRRGRRLYGAGLDFGHTEAARASLVDLERIRSEHGRAELPFQSGVPGDLDLAMFALGPASAVRHRRAFTEATLREIGEVRVLAGPQSIFQIEVPAELVLLARAPARVRRVLAERLGAGIVELARGSAVGTRFGIHLCLGDMNHRALGRMGDVGPLVELSNALARRWPADRPLTYVHAPLAAAEEPAPTDPAFYAPLATLALDPGTRFVAGFAHETQSLTDQRVIQAMVEDQLGGPVDVSSSCGLGRRSPERGRAVLERIAALVDA